MPNDPNALRILDLEDDPLDTELIQANLAEGGITCEIVRVQTRADFEAALENADFDLVLSDYSLPSFDGLSALKLAKEIRPEVPFILVSRAIGEERAIVRSASPPRDPDNHGGGSRDFSPLPPDVLTGVTNTNEAHSLRALWAVLRTTSKSPKGVGQLACLRSQKRFSLSGLFGELAVG